MPLAIELAAARVRLLPPDAILARLERQFELLATGARDVPERQRTLRGAIAWSYDLLEPPARHLLDRLSCFVGGCDLEIAEEVCGPAEELGMDVFDGIAELAEQSLIRRSEAGGEIRFSMPDTIRAFAAERLEARGEADEIRRRHARAFLGLVEAAAPELTGDDQRRWLERLERDHDNLRAALTWARRDPGAGDGRRLRLPAVALLAEARPPVRGPAPARRPGGSAVVRRATRSARPTSSRRSAACAYWQGDFVGGRAGLPGRARDVARDRRPVRDRQRPLQPRLHLQHRLERHARPPRSST